MTGSGIDITIIDSGINPGHSHVGAVEGGASFDLDAGGGIVRGTEFTDRIGHGTAIAGVIREKAPAARLYAVRIFHAELTASAPLLPAALEWAIERDTKMIHLSLGTEREEYRERLGELCLRAYERDIIIVASARSPDDPVFPASFETVIGVCWDKECEGDSLVRHPGGTIEFGACGRPRPLPGLPQEMNFRGASFAAARVTACAAQLLEGNPRAGTSWVRERLAENAAAVKAGERDIL